MAERKVQLAGVDAVQLLGFNDANLQLIEDRFGATITVRGDLLTVRGSESDTIKIEKVFKELSMRGQTSPDCGWFRPAAVLRRTTLPANRARSPSPPEAPPL